MSRPTTPHPVSPVRPRPLPGPKPAPQPRPSRMSLRLAIAEYVGIAACLIASIAIVTWFGRADLLTFLFLMTYLIVSLLSPMRRPKSPRPVSSSGAGTAVTLPPHVGPQGRRAERDRPGHYSLPLYVAWGRGGR